MFTSHMRRDVVDYGLLFFAASLYGATFMLIAIAVQTVQPMTVVAGRQALAALIFAVVAWGVGGRLQDLHLANWRLWGLIFLSAFFGNSLPFFLTTWGQQKVDAGLAAIIISTMPLITLVLLHLIGSEERLNRQKLLGLAFGLCGIVILFGPEKLAGLGEDAIRQYAIFGSAISFAINIVIMKSLVDQPRYPLLAAILLVSFVLVLPFAIAEQPWLSQPSYYSLLAIVAIGIMVSAIGSLLSFVLLERRGAVFSSQINYLMPLMGVFWAWLFLAEMPEPKVWLALSMILAGIAIVRYRAGNKINSVENLSG